MRMLDTLQKRELTDAIGRAIASSLATGEGYTVIQMTNDAGSAFAGGFYHVSRTAVERKGAGRLASHRRVTPFYLAALVSDNALSVTNSDN